LPVVVVVEAERGNVVRTAREDQTHAGQPRHPRQARDRRERQ